MDGEYKMSESQGQQKEGCLKKIIDFLNGLLPWLRFGVNIIFYIALIWVIISAGNKLWINTLPQEPKAINELIKVIEENTKTVTTQHHFKEKTKGEQEFKDSSPSYYRNPIWLPSLDSAKTTIETSKAEDVPESYTIQKDDFENILKAVALTSRQEIADDYHKSFSILVAILAIFGIGFPIIVALVQHSFNDRDLDKIEKTATKADEATKQVNSLKTEANKATEIALTAANESTVAAKSATQATDDATKAVNDANKAIIDANNSLNENEKLKNEVLLLSQTLFDEISTLDAVLAVPLTKEKSWFSLLISLRFRAIINKIREIEIKIRNHDLDANLIKYRLENEKTYINNTLNHLMTLTNDNAEIMSLKNIYGDSKIYLYEYKKVLTKIKNNLSQELHDVTDELEETVQEAIVKITDKEKTLPPEDNK